MALGLKILFSDLCFYLSLLLSFQSLESGNNFDNGCHNIDMSWDSMQNWFLSLGTEYGVNPFIFGAIYIGAIPFFSLSIGRLIQNYRQGRSIVLPALSAMFFFISAYIYLIFAGKNVPWWVYGVVVLLIVLGVYSTIKKVRRQISEGKEPPEVSEDTN